jgi:hypothetical protein
MRTTADHACDRPEEAAPRAGWKTASAVAGTHGRP